MPPEKISFDYSTPKTLLITFSGDWQIAAGLLPVNEVDAQLASHPDISGITLRVSEDLLWDSGFIVFLLQLMKDCAGRNITVSREGLPPGAQKLLALALQGDEKKLPSSDTSESFLEQTGERVLRIVAALRSWLDFLGDITVSFGRAIRGKAYFRHDDFMLILRRCGVETLPLVSLISLLVGMILAFVGSIQLQLFGAQIFISDIVGIAMVRVLAAVMTGIIMSGRIGASFAAELGMMQSNEEIDALKTLGVSPVEFLVIPRVLALVIMMPLLTIYADLMGIAGGFFISAGMLDLNPVEYLDHTKLAVKLSYVWVGLIHSVVFGVIVAVSGCLRGMTCERNAAGVGRATTSAVVTGITGIVIATAIITFMCHILGV